MEDKVSAVNLAAKMENDEDVVPSQFEAKKLKFNSFIREGDCDGRIDSITMRQRAKEMRGNLGLVDGENLKNQMNKSKEEFKHLQDKCIVLPGTLVYYSDDDLPEIAYLCWGGDSWGLCLCWFEDDWGKNDLFACSE